MSSHTFRSFTVLLLSAAFGLQLATGAVTPAGSGAYGNGLPPGEPGPANRNGVPAIPKVVDGLIGPYPTNSWWSSLIWQFHPENPYSEPMFAHPLAYRANPTGLGLGYPKNYFVTQDTPSHRGHSFKEYHYPYDQDMIVGLEGLLTSETLTEGASDWLVTARWEGVDNTILRATIGHGLPFAYFEREGSSRAEIWLAGDVTVWANNGSTLGVTVKGKPYGIFGPTGSVWQIHGNRLVSDLSGKDFFSVAILPVATLESLTLFSERAFAFPVDSRVSWNFDKPTASLTTVFELETELRDHGANRINRPLQALYRHQWLHSSATMTSHHYTSSRGIMKLHDGASFSVEPPFHGVIPNLPAVAIDGIDGFNEARLYAYIDDLYQQPRQQLWMGLVVEESYWVGKAMGRLAQLVPIADQVGHEAARDRFLNELRLRLEDWFDGTQPNSFHYEPVWGTLIGYPASFGSDTQLNDHHFHWAYYIIAAATVGRYDQDWAARYGPMVDLLIRDAASPDRNDPLFPFLRAFDPYAGHAWANGSALFAAGNNQESSSESMHFATAVTLWGAVTGNDTLRDLGIFLYATEATAIREYWFDVDGEVFPSEFNRPKAGIVWGDGVSYAIWWDGTVQELHGINFLPITAGSLYLGHYPDYLRDSQNYMITGGGGDNDVWRDVHASVQALYDPAGAIARLDAGYTPEWGESRARAYHWVHQLNRLGRVDTTVTADTPHFGVFRRGDTRNYVAWNPTATATTVQFSDGFSLELQPFAMGYFSDGQAGFEDVDPGEPGPTPEPPVEPSPTPEPDPDGSPAGQWNYDFATIRFVESTGGMMQVIVEPVAPLGFVDIHYRVNNGTQLSVRMVENNGLWTHPIVGLNPGDSVVIKFTYQRNGLGYDSTSGTVIYSGNESTDPGEEPVVAPPPPPPSDSTAPGEPEVSFTREGDNTVRVSFIPVVPALFVDIHYRLNNGPQLNVRMNGANAAWDYLISGVQPGDRIDYSFTYEQNGPAFSPPWATYIVPSLPINDDGGTEPDPTPQLGFTESILTEIHFRVTPTLPVQQATLLYRLGNSTWQETDMTPDANEWKVALPLPDRSTVIEYHYRLTADSDVLLTPVATL